MQSLRQRAQQLKDSAFLSSVENDFIFGDIQELKNNRKRKQLSDKIESDKKIKKHSVQTNENSSQNSTTIYDLPAEVYYVIFECLDAKSLANLRQVNHYFKSIIDNCAFIWRKRIKLVHCLNNKIEFESYLKFTHSNPYVGSIDLECSKNLQNIRSLNVFESDKQVDMNLINLNVNNMFLFENIKTCKNLKISSLVLPSNQNHFNIKKQFKTLERDFNSSRSVKNFFRELESFDLNCLSYDLKLHTYFNPLNEANFVELFLSINFKNLTYLCLRGYNKNLNDLLISLHRNFKSLRHVKFEDCYSSDIVPVRFQEKNKIQIDSLVLNNCSNVLCHNLIFDLIDLNVLKDLQLYSLNTINFDCDFSLNFIKSLDRKLKSLEKFQTCICWKYFKKINFQFSENSTITEFQLVRSPLVLRSLDETINLKYVAKFEEYKLFELDTIEEFLKDYLILNNNSTFKYLRMFTFELKLNDCCADSLERLNNIILKFYKNFIYLITLNIHLYCVQHAHKKKKCKLYKKYCYSKKKQLKFNLNEFVNGSNGNLEYGNSSSISKYHSESSRYQVNSKLHVYFKYIILK